MSTSVEKRHVNCKMKNFCTLSLFKDKVLGDLHASLLDIVTQSLLMT